MEHIQKSGFFATRQYPPAKKQHKYAIMIAARNEETVIGNLIDSINAQKADLVVFTGDLQNREPQELYPYAVLS